MDACPPSLKLYAHLYACDALVQLSRSSEALEHLTAALESNEPLVTVASCTGAEPPAAADGDGLDCVRNPYSLLLGASAGGGQVAARATLYANLAVVHALRGDVHKMTESIGSINTSLETIAQTLVKLSDLPEAWTNLKGFLSVVKWLRENVILVAITGAVMWYSVKIIGEMVG
jgi:hypothetical protein